MALVQPASPVRCGATWLTGSAVAALTLRLLLPQVGDPAVLLDLAAPATGFDVALRHLAAVGLLGCVLWWWVVTTATVGAALRGRPAPRLAGCPGLLRRLVVAGVGAAAVGGLAGGPALAGGHAVRADPEQTRPLRSGPVGGITALRGLPLPDRAESTGPRVVGAATPDVTVRSGDTLWSVAARGLPPGSPDPAVVDRWHEIYHANRRVIGPDPDHLVPGQRLRIPASHPREERP